MKSKRNSSINHRHCLIIITKPVPDTSYLACSYSLSQSALSQSWLFFIFVCVTIIKFSLPSNNKQKQKQLELLHRKQLQTKNKLGVLEDGRAALALWQHNECCMMQDLITLATKILGKINQLNK